MWAQRALQADIERARAIAEYQPSNRVKPYQRAAEYRQILKIGRSILNTTLAKPCLLRQQLTAKVDQSDLLLSFYIDSLDEEEVQRLRKKCRRRPDFQREMQEWLHDLRDKDESIYWTSGYKSGPKMIEMLEMIVKPRRKFWDLWG
jgi:hypothetical protein